MARRAVLSQAASAIIGIGLIRTISTDASAYRAGVYRGGAYRGGVYRGGYYRGVRPGVAVGIGAAAVGAAAVGAAAAGAYYAPGYYASLPPQSVVHMATTITPPTTAAYPRHRPLPYRADIRETTGLGQSGHAVGRLGAE